MVKDTGGGSVMNLRDYFAAKAMQSLLLSKEFGEINFDDISMLAYDMADEMIKARIDNDRKDVSLNDIGLTTYTLNLLNNNGINTLDDLVSKRELDLMKLPLCGAKTISDIKRALKNLNLSLAV